MGTYIVGFFTFILLLLSLFIILIVLMQRSSANAGMGGALGASATESAFGVESGNVLNRWTIYATVGFFILCFTLYLGHMAHHKKLNGLPSEGLPEIISVEPDVEAGPTPGSLTEVPGEN